LPGRSSSQPGRRDRNQSWIAPCHPYSTLLPVGFAVPRPLPSARCALTAPFHLSPDRGPWRSALCGTFPDSGFPEPPDVIRHRGFRGARTFLPRLRGGDRPTLWRAHHSAVRQPLRAFAKTAASGCQTAMAFFRRPGLDPAGQAPRGIFQSSVKFSPVRFADLCLTPRQTRPARRAVTASSPHAPRRKPGSIAETCRVRVGLLGPGFRRGAHL